MYTIWVVFASCFVLWCHGGIALVSFSVLWQLDVRRGFCVCVGHADRTPIIKSNTCVCIAVHSTQGVPQQLKCYQLKRASQCLLAPNFAKFRWNRLRWLQTKSRPQVMTQAMRRCFDFSQILYQRPLLFGMLGFVFGDRCKMVGRFWW